jgi:superfamily I DNA/RNA helicase
MDEDSITSLTKDAETVWERMCDVKDGLPMSHDGYIKLMQLAGQGIDTDVIMVDEYQDTNEATRAILENSDARKVYVGDESQAIYQFRGATNAMDKADVDLTLTLSKSFRFGQGVADIANAIVGEFRDLRVCLTGLGEHSTKFWVDVDEPYTRISRTNAALFAGAVDAIMEDRAFGLIGDPKGYNFDLLMDAYHLLCGKKNLIKSQMLKHFDDYASFEQYAADTEDKEAGALCKVVKNYGHKLPSLIDAVLKAAAKFDGDGMLLTTAHKSKGMEWGQVILAPDFTDMVAEEDLATMKIIPPPEAEVNLAYVAATRAQRCIMIEGKLGDWLRDRNLLG